MIEVNLNQNNIALLPITLEHVRNLDELPLHHRDPFDRMLIAQARTEGMALVSADATFAAYTLDVLW